MRRSLGTVLKTGSRSSLKSLLRETEDFWTFQPDTSGSEVTHTSGAQSQCVLTFISLRKILWKKNAKIKLLRKSLWEILNHGNRLWLMRTCPLHRFSIEEEPHTERNSLKKKKRSMCHLTQSKSLLSCGLHYLSHCQFYFPSCPWPWRSAVIGRWSSE